MAKGRPLGFKKILGSGRSKPLAAGDAKTIQIINGGGSSEAGGGTGDVIGPASATANAFSRFNGTTGEYIKDSAVTADDSGNVTTAGTVNGRDIAADGITLDGLGGGGGDMVLADPQTVTGLKTFDVAGGVQFALLPSAPSSPTYYTQDNTINAGGKKWRVGQTGAIAGNATFDFYNETDAITPLTMASNGNVGFGITPTAKVHLPTATVYTGGIFLGESGAAGGLWHDNSGLTTTYLESHYNNAGAVLKIRMRVSGTPIDALTLTGAGVGTFLSTLTASNLSGTNTGDSAANATANTYADGKVADAINDGTTTIAPSQNAVFDALALKLNAANPAMTGNLTGGSQGLFSSQMGISGASAGHNTYISYLDGIWGAFGASSTVKVKNGVNIQGNGYWGASNTVIRSEMLTYSSAVLHTCRSIFETYANNVAYEWLRVDSLSGGGTTVDFKSGKLVIADDGVVTADTAGFKPKSYTTGTLPTASTMDGVMLHDSTLNSIVRSNGTTWDTM